MPEQPWSPFGPPGGGDLETLLKSPIRNSNDAIRLMRTARNVWELEEQRTRDVVSKIDDWLKPLATIDNAHRYLRNRGFNLTVAVVVCGRTRSEFSSLRERLRTYPRLNSGVMNLFDRATTALEASAEYLDILAGILRPTASRNVQAIHKLSEKVVITVAVAGVLITLPLAVAFLGEVGAGAAVAHVVRTGVTYALYFVGTNPVAGLAITDFVVGTLVAIGLSGGPEKFMESLTTAEGVGGTAIDIIIMRLTIRSGRPVPRGGGNRRSSNRPRRVQITGEKVKQDQNQITIRIKDVREIDDLPDQAPPSARVPAVAVSARGKTMKAIQDVRANPKVNRPDGWSCDDAAELLAQQLPGGRPEPVSVGDHVAYVYPAKNGPNQRVLDVTAVQFTDKNHHPLPQGVTSPRISWATIIAEGLEEAIDSGIFTREQHNKLVKLIQSWRPR